MELWQVYDKFYDQQTIKFSKGYKEFEEAYEELKEELNLQREEISHGNWTEVIITKGGSK